MILSPLFGTFVSGAILLAGLIDDMRTRKVRNSIILAAAPISLLTAYLTAGWPGVAAGLIAFVVAIGMTLPLVLVKALGGGDLKLLAAFALSSQWNIVATTFICSLLWGTLLGLIQAALRGELLQVVKGSASLLVRKAVPTEKMHKVPFTVALFFGWLTALSLNRIGGLL